MLNIWFSTGENKELSNLAFRPFEFEGREYVSVEHAYQCLKSGSFDSGVYSKYPKKAGVKIVGKGGPKREGNWNLGLMERLIKESFLQNPQALEQLKRTENQVLTHKQDKGIWGQKFPQILMRVRKEFPPNLEIELERKAFESPDTPVKGVLGRSDKPW